MGPKVPFFDRRDGDVAALMENNSFHHLTLTFDGVSFAKRRLPAYAY